MFNKTNINNIKSEFETWFKNENINKDDSNIK